MKVLVLGATGATGSQVVTQLIAQGHDVIALVRSPLPEQPQLLQIQGTALNLASEQLRELIAKVDAVVCCLGHNLNLKGMYGAPRMLVRDSIKRVVNHVNHNRLQPLKLVLMGSSGVRGAGEKIGLAERLVVGLIRTLVPPHRDNEQAAEYLHKLKHDAVEWVIVRPDALVNSDLVDDYQLQPKPIRSAIFDAGKVSRINVAHFMVQLTQQPKLWLTWRNKMPVIYGEGA